MDMVFLLIVLCLHVECLKLYFLGHLNLEKIHFWTRKINPKIFPYTEPFSSFPLPRIFCYVFWDYKINIRLMSKKLRIQEWNRKSKFAKQNLPDRKNVTSLRHMYFYKYIRLHVMLCMFLTQQYIVNIFMCYMKFKPIFKKRCLLLSPIDNCLSLVVSEAVFKTRFQCNIFSGRWFKEILIGIWGSDKGKERQPKKNIS